MSMKPTEIKDLLKQRGWINVDLAAHWDISAAWLSTMINRADLRPKVYDDAFRGLPPRSEVNVVRQKRHIRKPPKPKPRLWSFAQMFPTGRLYELIDNQLGDEGTRFVVAGTRVDGDAHTSSSCTWWTTTTWCRDPHSRCHASRLSHTCAIWALTCQRDFGTEGRTSRIDGTTALSGPPLARTTRWVLPVLASRKTTPGDETRRRAPAAKLDVFMGYPFMRLQPHLRFDHCNSLPSTPGTS